MYQQNINRVLLSVYWFLYIPPSSEDSLRTRYHQTCEITSYITWPSYLCTHGKMRCLIKKKREKRGEGKKTGKEARTMFPVFSVSVLTIGILLVMEG